LDFGAGIGTLSKIWNYSQKDSLIDCLEPDPGQVRIINERGLKGVIQIRDTDKYDYIFTSNVLEHIEDDKSALRFIFNHLNQNGKVGIFVPANKY
jgi:2-polyprenyl-3-methyl-5-hydroxy-6-metoxy-1,4-benzoquinol methylase